MAGDDVTSATIDRDFVPTLRDGVAFVPVADEAVLYAEATGDLVELDAIAAATCRVLDGSTTVASGAAELAAAFDAPVVTVEADVLAFVRRLGQLGLLHGVAGTDASD